MSVAAALQVRTIPRSQDLSAPRLPLTARALFLTAPWPFAGHYFHGSFVRASVVFAGAAFVAVMPTLARRDFAVATPFLPFLLWAAAGILMSPTPTHGKGVMQLAQLLLILAGTVATINCVRRVGIDSVLRVIGLGTLILGLTGLLQWVGLLAGWSIADFSWLNNIVGGQYWRPHEFYGALPRINGLDSEPAFLTESLQLFSVFAMALFLYRRQLQSRPARLVVLAAALAFIVQILALSLLGYMLIGIAFLALVFQMPRRHLGRALAGIAALSVVGVIAVPSLGGALTQKLASIDALTNSSALYAREGDTGSVSAVALAANLDVTRAVLHRHLMAGGGLGSHAVSYSLYAPAYLVGSHAAELNAQDAGSLALRLLSETGVVGLVLFLAGWLRVLRSGIRRKATDWTSAGLAAAALSVSAYVFVRLGIYFDAPFWLTLALMVGLEQVRREVQP